MGRATKIAIMAALAGLLGAAALAAALASPAPRASALPISGADARPAPHATPRRCRTLTFADSSCEAAWEAQRRHFFGQGEAAQ